MLELKLEGVDLLNRRLSALTRKVQKKIIRKAVRESLKPILRDARRNAKTIVGGNMGTTISKNLASAPFRRQKRGQYGMRVYIKPLSKIMKSKASSRSAKGFFAMMEAATSFVYVTKSGKRYFIPSAIEYGHAFPGKGGGKSKDVPARPFMRPAVDSNKNQAIMVFSRVMHDEIEREAMSVG